MRINKVVSALTALGGMVGGQVALAQVTPCIQDSYTSAPTTNYSCTGHLRDRNEDVYGQYYLFGGFINRPDASFDALVSVVSPLNNTRVQIRNSLAIYEPVNQTAPDPTPGGTVSYQFSFDDVAAGNYYVQVLGYEPAGLPENLRTFGVTVSIIPAVPTPASGIVMLGCLAALWEVRRRRQQS